MIMDQVTSDVFALIGSHTTARRRPPAASISQGSRVHECDRTDHLLSTSKLVCFSPLPIHARGILLRRLAAISAPGGLSGTLRRRARGDLCGSDRDSTD